MEKMNAEETNKLIPHLHSFFVAIGNVLNELNFKVSFLSLTGKKPFFSSFFPDCRSRS